MKMDIQEYFNHCITSKNTFYHYFYLPLEHHIKTISKYNDIKELFVYSKNLENKNDFYSHNDLIKIKINNMLFHLTQAHTSYNKLQ